MVSADIIIEKSNPVLRLPADSGYHRTDYIPGIYLSCHGLEILFYAVSEWVFHASVLKVAEQYGTLLSFLILITDFPCVDVWGIKGRGRITVLFCQHRPPLSQQPVQVIMVYLCIIRGYIIFKVINHLIGQQEPRYHDNKDGSRQDSCALFQWLHCLPLYLV